MIHVSLGLDFFIDPYLAGVAFAIYLAVGLACAAYIQSAILNRKFSRPDRMRLRGFVLTLFGWPVVLPMMVHYTWGWQDYPR